MGFFEQVGKTAEQHKTKSSETFTSLKDKIKGATSKISGFMKNMPFYASAFAAEGAKALGRGAVEGTKATGAAIEQGTGAVAAKVETAGDAVDKKVEAAVKMARNAIEGTATKAQGFALRMVSGYSEWRKNKAQEVVDKMGSRLETMQRALESIQEKQSQLQKQKEVLLNALGALEGRTEAPAALGAI